MHGQDIAPHPRSQVEVKVLSVWRGVQGDCARLQGGSSRLILSSLPEKHLVISIYLLNVQRMPPELSSHLKNRLVFHADLPPSSFVSSQTTLAAKPSYPSSLVALRPAVSGKFKVLRSFVARHIFSAPGIDKADIIRFTRVCQR